VHAARLLVQDAHFHGRKGVFKVGSSNRPREIVALGRIAFRYLDKAVLRSGFHAFGNHWNIQSVRHSNNDAGYGFAILVGYTILNEQLIILMRSTRNRVI